MTLALLFVAGGLAGMINAIAGGGTLISFPALLWMGRDPILANATNAVALGPASFAGMLGFRDEVRRSPRWLLLLVLPSLLGGTAGAILLLHTPAPLFESIVPFLLLGATLLLAVQEAVSRRITRGESLHAASAGWITFAFLFQFLVALYGGYFGAGMGILMLAALGLIGLTDLHQMNGLKNLFAICINGVAAIYFAISGAVLWNDALVMTAGAILGAWLGTRIAHRVGRRVIRVAVVVIGLLMSAALLLRR